MSEVKQFVSECERCYNDFGTKFEIVFL